MIHPCIEELSGIQLPLWDVKDFILEQLDEGYYGTVYKATHCTSKEVFVLKELKEDEEESRTMFIDEIQMLSKLRHPNVIKCKGVVFQDGHLSYLTEFIEGGTLQELLIDQDSLQLPWQTYLNITLDVARGMAYLHLQGIIHRDLNSKNILVREIYQRRYMAFIIDLGLSYQKPEESMPTEDVPHGPVGSPYHIAPELFNDDPCSQKTDVFSFGIILCEVISGCPGADPEELPRTIDFGLNVEEFSELASDCPPEYLNLAVRCCQVDPKLRPQFDDIVKILDIILDRLEENDSASDLKPDEQFRAFKSDTVSSNDDYIIESSVLCTCGKLRKSRSDLCGTNDCTLLDTIDPIKHTEVYRTSSRRLMRKCVSRCSICGGRKLQLEEVKDSNDKVALSIGVDINVDQVPNKEKADFDSVDIVNNQDEHILLRAGTVAADRSSITDITMNTSDTKNALNLEKSSLYPAGALLKQDRYYLSSKTSQLAANTPGRLPTFFLRLLRRRRSNPAANLFSEARWRSLNKLFHISKSPSFSQKHFKHTSSHSPETPSSPKHLHDPAQDWAVSLYFEKQNHTTSISDLCNSSGDEDILSKSLPPAYFEEKDKGIKCPSVDRTHSLEVPLPVIRNVTLRSSSYTKKKRPRSLIDTLRKKKTSYDVK